MNYTSGLSSMANRASNEVAHGSGTTGTNVWQEIISSDAKFNLYRINSNSQLRTLYMRRRTQLLRENQKKYKENDLSCNIRKNYLNWRNQILESKYGRIDQMSMHSFRTSKGNSKAPSIDSQSLNYEMLNKHRYYSFNNSSNIATALNPKHSSIYSSKESLNSLNTTPNAFTKVKSTASFSNNSNSLDDSYTMAGVHHIFENNHKGAVTRVKFANNDKSLLASCSLDGCLIICQVIPSPATIIYKLEGHQSGIMDIQWSMTNDLIVSASLDGTSKVWQVSKGNCMRTLKDTCGAQVLCCCFQPLNENMIFTGNSKGIIQVYNLSTGIIANKNCIHKLNGRIQCICFDSAGSTLWAGDDKGSINSFHFDAYTLKLTKLRKVVNNNGYSITSIAYKNLNNKESALLVNALPNYLLLYRLDNVSSRLRKRIFIRQSEHQIRSTFCPFVSSKKQPNACLVCTGSEDCCVYIYDMENDDKPLVNKLQGHSTPVLDVTFNYDQSLLASGDAQGTVIIWKTNENNNKI